MKALYLFLSALMLSACVSTNPTLSRSVYTSIDDAVVQQTVRNETTLQGYFQDGSSVEFLDGWSVVDSAFVEGRARSRDNKGNLLSDDFRLFSQPVSEVVLWRTSRVLSSSERPVFYGSFFLVAMDAGIGVYCLINPKDCFGSCPTFYQGDDAYLFHSDAEGFTHAITPTLEHADIDALPEIMEPGQERIVMKNEALETHNIRSVRLHSVPVVAGTDVLHTTDNELYRVRDAGDVQVRYDGQLLAEVQDRDGLEWFVSANANDLAAKVKMELAFEPKEGVEYGLQVTYRQSLMSTYLFYGTLQAMGSDYGRRMVIMDQTPWQKEWLLEGGIMQYLGGIEVQNERGKALGAFVETGPIAHNTQVLPLGELDGPLQLELTEGLWRVDHIKLVELLEPVEARVHEVVALEKNGEPAGKDLERLQNVEEHLMSLPGENWTLHFELLDVPSHVFLESEGYYHEWTRTTWNDPGAPRALNHMILHPRQFLRDEAAAYKVYEDTMEPLFWQSKIQTPILSNHEN